MSSHRYAASYISAGLLVCVFLAACEDPGKEVESSGPAYEFVNGRWFDGSGFERKTMYTSRGVIHECKPARIDSTINLGGGFVVPPYGEAHTHILADPELLDDQIGMYMEEGIFYVMNQDPLRVVGPDVQRRVNTPQSVDVIYPEGVIAPRWSIVARLYEELAGSGAFGPGMTLDSLDGAVIHLIDDMNDLETKWDRIADLNDDFLKVILAFSEDHEARRILDDSAFELGRYSRLAGIAPDLLDDIIRRAHADGLLVSVHIETAADFRLAVRSGADYIAHLPASWQISSDDLSSWMLTPADAAAAAQAGLTVITTAYTPDEHPDAGKFAEVHTHNLGLLREADVRLAGGSDQFDATSIAEIRYLAGLGVFSNVELLVMLAQDTPRAIFPDRKVGALTEGMEASFLVLADNPLADLDHLTNIRYRVKDGRLFDAAPVYELTHLADDIHLMHVPGQSMYDNVVVLSNDAGLLLVDTGFMETMSSQRRALAALSSDSVRRVINTHFHHAGGNPAFAGVATILAHERTGVRLASDAEMYDLVPLEALPVGALPDSTFADSLTLLHGDERLDIYHYPNAHTDGDVVVFFREANVVATGDLFVPGLGACDYPNGCDWQSYLDGVERLVEMVPKDAIVVPGHGRISTHADIEEYDRFLTEITDIVRTHMRDGKSLDELLEAGLPEEWRYLEEDGLPAEFFLTNAYRSLTGGG